MPPLSPVIIYSQIGLHQAGIQTLANTILTAITFDTFDFGDITLWNITNPTKILTPNWALFARVAGNILFDPTGLGLGSRRVTFRKNGLAFVQTPANNRPSPAAGSPISDHDLCASGWFPVIGGTDYLEMYAQQDSGFGNDIGGGGGCWVFAEFKNR